jgi:hypothetical protein
VSRDEKDARRSARLSRGQESKASLTFPTSVVMENGFWMTWIPGSSTPRRAKGSSVQPLILVNEGLR